MHATANFSTKFSIPGSWYCCHEIRLKKHSQRHGSASQREPMKTSSSAVAPFSSSAFSLALAAATCRPCGGGGGAPDHLQWMTFYDPCWSGPPPSSSHDGPGSGLAPPDDAANARLPKISSSKTHPNGSAPVSIFPSGPDCTDDILWEQSGWHNLLTGPEMWGLAALPTMARLHTDYGYRGMPDLTHWSSGWNMNASSCVSLGMPANCSEMRLVLHGGDLAPNWQLLLDAIVAVYQPYIDNKTVVGIFIGDELVATHSWSCNAMAAIATRLKQRNPRILLYSNEGGCWPCLGTAAGAQIVHAMDYFSYDRYRGYKDEAAVSRAWAEENLYPHMRPEQKLLLVPGLYATDPVHCIKFSAKSNFSCPLDKQEDELLLKLLDFWAWAKNDTRVIGFKPWHLASFAEGNNPVSALTLGAYSMPRVLALLIHIGRQIVANNPN
eukprot:SAG31_NODE_1673_length_7560_cov_3.528749_4_plen_438_part_00